jgi:hypothetical protein
MQMKKTLKDSQYSSKRPQSAWRRDLFPDVLPFLPARRRSKDNRTCLLRDFGNEYDDSSFSRTKRRLRRTCAFFLHEK